MPILSSAHTAERFGAMRVVMQGTKAIGTCRRFAGFPCLCYGATSDHGVSPGDCVSLLICSSKLSLNGFPHFWQVQSSQASKEFCGGRRFRAARGHTLFPLPGELQQRIDCNDVL